MSDEPRDFHKPVRRSPDTFDRHFAAHDQAAANRVAHATASALLSRVRAEPTDEVVGRLLAYSDDHGIDAIAELWAQSPARTLPGTLWRLYLLQLMIHDDPATSALLYARGRERLESSDDLVAGAPAPAGPEELVALIDQILRGVFAGDFALALERASSFARVVAAGATALADDYDATEPERATGFTTRAARLSTYADDLRAAAALWRREGLA